MSVLRNALPDCLTWQSPLDMLTQLPAETRPDHVALIPLHHATHSEGEELSGAVCVSYLASPHSKRPQHTTRPHTRPRTAAASGESEGDEHALEWRAVAALPHRAMIKRMLSQDVHSTLEQIFDEGFNEGGPLQTSRAVQQPGELMILPPGAVYSCRVRGGDGPIPLLLQWLIVPASYSSASFARASPADKSRVLSAARFEQAPRWRQLHLTPLVNLGAYLSLVERVETHWDSRERLEGHSRSELLSLLRTARTLLSSEEAPAEATFSEHPDHAPRACMLCAQEIFNRCVRLERPLLAPPPQTIVFNPRRYKPWAEGQPGDFCMRCVAGGHLRTGGGQFSLRQHY